MAAASSFMQSVPSFSVPLRAMNILGLAGLQALLDETSVVRGEAPVTAANVLAFLEGRQLTVHYDGYTVCPLITGYGRVIRANNLRIE